MSIDAIIQLAAEGDQSAWDTIVRTYWRKVFNVNVEGALRMSQCIAPVMRDGGGGSIVNVGSMEGYCPSHPRSVVYGASKAAGHVEIRTKDGFASDFRSKIPSPRPLLGVYAKL